ncbi:hypothetical protein DD238_001748 [Peronospora effusa]|uniref:Uncharacterized protein n=1 Tax=Peronospora effusa TaxID=542832 RepID=A0A3M6VKC9_9STRA|nr:hypothetical protein DD238_001748 [Peronospora effusa]RQM14708.1 hypothetical protein DD237_005281 [Peronospora effusa]
MMSFFDTQTCLTVSGQLHGEMYACSKACTFGPTFRAENTSFDKIWIRAMSEGRGKVNFRRNPSGECICKQSTIVFLLRSTLTDRFRNRLSSEYQINLHVQKRLFDEA